MASKKSMNPKTVKAQIAQKQSENDLWVISSYLKDVKFAPRILGVDEADVWKKIEKLCELYENELATERAKNKKLTKQLNTCAIQLKKLLPAKKTQEEKPDGE